MNIVSCGNRPFCRFKAVDLVHCLKPRSLKEVAVLVAAVAITGIAAVASLGAGLICGFGFFSAYCIYKYCRQSQPRLAPVFERKLATEKKELKQSPSKIKSDSSISLPLKPLSSAVQKRLERSAKKMQPPHLETIFEEDEGSSIPLKEILSPVSEAVSGEKEPTQTEACAGNELQVEEGAAPTSEGQIEKAPVLEVRVPLSEPDSSISLPLKPLSSAVQKRLERLAKKMEPPHLETIFEEEEGSSIPLKESLSPVSEAVSGEKEPIQTEACAGNELQVEEGAAPTSEGQIEKAPVLEVQVPLSEPESLIVANEDARTVSSQIVADLIDAAFAHALNHRETLSPRASLRQQMPQMEIFPAPVGFRKAQELEAVVGLRREAGLPAKIPNKGNTCFAASILQTALFFQKAELSETIRFLQEKRSAQTNSVASSETIPVKDDAELQFKFKTLNDLHAILCQIENSNNKINPINFINILFKINKVLDEDQRVYRNERALAEIKTWLLLRHLSGSTGQTPDNSAEAPAIDPETCRWADIVKLAQKFQLPIPRISMRQQDADEIMTLIFDFIKRGNNEAFSIQEQSFGFFDGQFHPFKLNIYAGKRDIALDPKEPLKPFGELIRSSFIEPGPEGYKVNGKEITIDYLRTYLSQPPNMLLLPFKRYTHDKKKIAYPVQGIDEILTLPSDYFLNKESAHYRLDGVILHIGRTLNQGHYIALRRLIDAQGIVRFILANDDEIAYLSDVSPERLSELVGLPKEAFKGKSELERFLTLAQISYIPIYNRIG